MNISVLVACFAATVILIKEIWEATQESPKHKSKRRGSIIFAFLIFFAAFAGATIDQYEKRKADEQHNKELRDLDGKIIGGDSQCFLFISKSPSDSSVLQADVMNSDEFPIYDLTIQINDFSDEYFEKLKSAPLEKRYELSKTAQIYISKIGTLAPHSGGTVLDKFTLDKTHVHKLWIAFSGRNGFWNQHTSLTWTNNHWSIQNGDVETPKK